MKLLRFLFIFLFCLLPSLAFAGTTYYVDATDGNDNNSGTSMNRAWKTISRVNNHSFATGDDVYFKCGGTWNGTQLVIDWNGSANNRTIIGAYYNNGGTPVYGVIGSRPKLDGNSRTVPSSDSGLIRYYKGSGYVTIKDIHVYAAGKYGIEINQSGSYNTVENCHIQNTYKIGILIARSSYTKVKNNIVERSSYNYTPGASIVISAGDIQGSARYNTVKNNLVFHGWEGINVTKKAEYTTVENNTIYDCKAVKIYMDAAKYTTVRFNLIYDSADNASWNGRNRAIQIDNEDQRGYCFTGGHKIYGNLIAATQQGITVLNEYQDLTDANCFQNDNLIYSNTMVDTEEYNIRIDDQGYGNWSGNKVINNISLTLTAGSNHVKGVNAAGVIWSNNLFDENPGGKAATNAVIADPKLSKTSGWRSIPPGTAVGKEWRIQTGSAATNKGASISGYMERIYDSDFTADPIKVLKNHDSPPDIGAWIVGGQNPGQLPPPSDLIIEGQ